MQLYEKSLSKENFALRRIAMSQPRNTTNPKIQNNRLIKYLPYHNNGTTKASNLNWIQLTHIRAIFLLIGAKIASHLEKFINHKFTIFSFATTVLQHGKGKAIFYGYSSNCFFFTLKCFIWDHAALGQVDFTSSGVQITF